MNNETKNLQRQLEEATAAADAVDASLDAETASLRESWLAFGELLDTASGPTIEPPEMPRLPRRAVVPRRWLALSAAAALVASLLIAISLVISTMGPEQIAKPEIDTTPQVDPPPRTELVADELQWDDTLDEQIAQAGWQMVLVQQDRYRLDGPFSSLQDEIEQMEEDIDKSTL
jgi:hypothetical protein